jgi:hypothetical protein
MLMMLLTRMHGGITWTQRLGRRSSCRRSASHAKPGGRSVASMCAHTCAQRSSAPARTHTHKLQAHGDTQAAAKYSHQPRRQRQVRAAAKATQSLQRLQYLQDLQYLQSLAPLCPHVLQPTLTRTRRILLLLLLLLLLLIFLLHHLLLLLRGHQHQKGVGE